MNVKILITASALAVLAAGAAVAQTSSPAASSSPAPSADTTAKASGSSSTPSATHHRAHHKRMAMEERRAHGGEYAAPPQPIPYAQLEAYMKASPRERLAMDRQANTGGAADTSATAPAQTTPPPTQPQ